MKRIGLRPFLCALVLIVPLITPSTFAQDFRGAITGTVTDPSGGVLPGVTVTVTNVATNVSSATVTDSKGFYRIAYLNSGDYSVEGKLEGLKTVVHRGVSVHVGDSLKLDLKMEP